LTAVLRGDWLEPPDWTQTVEDLGFDSFWINDRTGTSWRDCWTALAPVPLQTSEGASSGSPTLAMTPEDNEARGMHDVEASLLRAVLAPEAATAGQPA
jgi:hypothetical protein